MKDNNKYVFFLGGHDLEMIEIRNILDSLRIAYFDKNLKWGAKLSDYEKEITQIDSLLTIVGVELIADMIKPSNYISIDHHNELSYLPSSIEQVAKFFGGVELNRHQQLVAANDAGYIPAMKKLRATKDEIEKIRKLDRKAQGVTEKDEQLAIDSINNSLETFGNVTIVKSMTPFFSPITDRLYPNKNLIVYTDNELTYYGVHTEEIAINFQKLIEQGNAYSGGGHSGFFGLAFAKFKKQKLLDIKDEIITIVNQNETI